MKRKLVVLAVILMAQGVFGATFPTEFVTSVALPSTTPVVGVFPSSGSVIVVQENGSEIIDGNWLSDAPGYFTRVFPDGRTEIMATTVPVTCFEACEISPDREKIVILSWAGYPYAEYLALISADTFSQDKVTTWSSGGFPKTLTAFNDRCFMRSGIDPAHSYLTRVDHYASATMMAPFYINGAPEPIRGSGLGFAFRPINGLGRLVYAGRINGTVSQHSRLLLTDPYDLTVVQRDDLTLFPYSPDRDIYYVTGYGPYLHVVSSEGIHKVNVDFVITTYTLTLDWEVTGVGVKPNSHLRPVIEGENSVCFLGQDTSTGEWSLYRATSDTVPNIIGSPWQIPDSEIQFGERRTIGAEEYWYDYIKELREARGWFYFASVYPTGSAIHIFSDDLTSHSALFQGHGLIYPVVVGEYLYAATMASGEKRIEIFRAPPEPMPSLTVISPNGGETWQEGTQHNIMWGSTGQIGDVALSYSTDGGGNWTMITPLTPNDGSELWTLPASPSNQCLIQIACVTTPTIFDQSDAFFAISEVPPAKTLTVISPNGGETFLAGFTKQIVWSSTGNIPNVALDYSIDGGSHWTPIFSSTPNDGSEEWVIPNTPSINCLVRVKDIVDPSVYDISNGPFTIKTEGPLEVKNWQLYSEDLTGPWVDFPRKIARKL